MAKRKSREALYILAIIIVILAAAFAYVSLNQAEVEQPASNITSGTEANNVQQNVTQSITSIKSALEQLNRSLG